jgi:hypothetical protein
MRIILSTFAAALIGATAASAATVSSVTGNVTTFFDQPTYDTAVTTFAADSFDDTDLNTAVFASDDPAVALDGDFRFRNGRLERIAGGNNASDPFTTFNLAAGISAISFEINNFSASESALFTLSNGDSFVLNGAPNGANGFFGFGSDTDFDSFTVSDVTATTFRALEITAGSINSPSPIPLPASLPLLLGAMGIVGWTARRSRRNG